MIQMNRRLFLQMQSVPAALVFAGVLANRPARQTQALTVTPFAAPTERYCSLDLDAPDYTIALAITELSYPDQHDQIEWIVDSRAKAAGVGACAIFKSERNIYLNAQRPIDGDRLRLDELAAMLAAKGQISMIDPGEDELQPGDWVQIGQMTATGSRATPVAARQYETVLDHADFFTIEEHRSETTGEPLAMITLTESGAERLLSYTATHTGGSCCRW